MSEKEKSEGKNNKEHFEYHRIAFDRVYGHIAALAERFNMVIAVCTLFLLIYFIIIGEDSIGYKVLFDNQVQIKMSVRMQTLLWFLYILGILLILVSVFVSLATSWRTVKPEKGNTQFFPKTVNSEEDAVNQIHRYLKKSEEEIRIRTNRMILAGCLTLLSVTLFSVFVFNAIIIHKCNEPNSDSLFCSTIVVILFISAIIVIKTKQKWIRRDP